MLVFPSYFKRERPDLEGHPATLVSYRFCGVVDEIYATLVVRLHYVTTFEKDGLWRFAADFKTQGGKRLGFKMTKPRDGEAELTVYMDPTVADDTKMTFIRYVHEHLKAKDPDLIRVRHYVCSNCATPVENRKAVEARLRRGEKDVVCVNCEKRVLLWDLIEKKFASPELRKLVRELDEAAGNSIDNESRELILVGHAFAIAGEAGQIFRPIPNSDWGIDGEIEFKDYDGTASGKRVYLQLKSGDSYLGQRKDGTEIFAIKNPRHAQYWQQQAYPVMLVIRTSDGVIRWMDVGARLKKMPKAPLSRLVFKGEPFTALSLRRLRDQLIPPPVK